MPTVTWNARDEDGRVIEVQAEIVDAEPIPEVSDPQPDEEPEA